MGEGLAVAPRTVKQRLGFPVRLQTPGLRAGVRASGRLQLLLDKGAILRVAQGRDGSAQGVSVAPPVSLIPRFVRSIR